jgi:hypothetical protein
MAPKTQDRCHARVPLKSVSHLRPLGIEKLVKHQMTR